MAVPAPRRPADQPWAAVIVTGAVFLFAAVLVVRIGGLIDDVAALMIAWWGITAIGRAVIELYCARRKE